MLHLLFGGIFCKVGHPRLFWDCVPTSFNFNNWCVALLEQSCNNCQKLNRDTAQNINHVYKAIQGVEISNILHTGYVQIYKIEYFFFILDSGCQLPTGFQNEFSRHDYILIQNFLN